MITDVLDLHVRIASVQELWCWAREAQSIRMLPSCTITWIILMCPKMNWTLIRLVRDQRR